MGSLAADAGAGAGVWAEAAGVGAWGAGAAADGRAGVAIGSYTASRPYQSCGGFRTAGSGAMFSARNHGEPCLPVGRGSVSGSYSRPG
ncbi:hypothetical protein ABZY02_05715 [Streptomyces sp. NPDC006649]|uniref:hypothetical protein n=1 Tax=Streptomyces sp. NPDC006649 TaxID=3156896 RepID=UPI0033B9F6A5